MIPAAPTDGLQEPLLQPRRGSQALGWLVPTFGSPGTWGGILTPVQRRDTNGVRASFLPDLSLS